MKLWHARRFRRAAWLLTLCLWLPPLGRADGPQPAARVDVILWFDTEDYLLPADDDAAQRLAEMLSERGIRATFKLVGEKARVLEQRGRTEVIAALAQHDIGYHANWHSVHPTPTEYLADCGLLDGIEEFVRREGPGAADVRRIFRVPVLSCYGQPGSSWASQAIAALKEIGVAPAGTPCYVDEGSHVGLDDRPFWYAGALVVYKLGPNVTRMNLHDPTALAPAQENFTAIAARLRSQDGGGLVSIYYHPCEWVHVRFWDGENFARGANPPREEWKVPPQRPGDETEAAFRRFGQYIDHIRAEPGVQFVTASDLPRLYPDASREVGADEAQLLELATRLSAGEAAGVDYQVVDGAAFSPADQFELLATALGERIAGQPPAARQRASGLLGPDGPPPRPRDETQVPWPAFRAAVLDVCDYLRKEGRVPARVHIGVQRVPPADFLAGLGRAYRALRQSGEFPQREGVALGQGVEVLTARHIAPDTPELFGGWVIHPVGFRAPKVLDVARLQAWTLKPALRAP